jgi:hypothetical protein
MINLRDRDVHYGEMGTATLPKMMEVPDEGNLYVHYNAVLFGPQPMAEHQNPDGVMVRSPALQSTIGLYVEIGGRVTQATAACADFIAQLRSLLNAVAVDDVVRAAASAESGAAGQGATTAPSI